MSLAKEAAWYTVYTRSRAEKKLHSLLVNKNIECFLPLRQILRRRSDRKKWIEQPLLPSYLFVHVTEKSRLDVLETPGAVCYICFDGKPATIPDKQIMYLKNFTQNKPKDLGIYTGNLDYRDKVEVISGPLKGVKGEIIQLRGRHRILLRFDALGYGVHAEISLHEIRLQKQPSAFY